MIAGARWGIVSMGLCVLACGGAASESARPTAAGVATDTPPAGLGRVDDAAELGPFAVGTLQVLGHRSSEAHGTVNSWLLLGERDAALIDAQLVLSEAREVVEMIRRSGRTLRWVWITHGHPDHATGLGPIVEAFPEARILAHPRVVETAAALFERYRPTLNRFFPGEIPESGVVPEALTGDSLELEGVALRVLTFEEGEAEITTALHVPSAQVLFCADLVYNRVFPWLNELHVAGIRAHLDALEARGDITTIFPGHGEPSNLDAIAAYRAYLDVYENEAALATNQADLIARVWRQYREWRSLAGLRFSATASIDARTGSGSTTAATQ
jgi:glyoxylase-like metal-dependent hydrolase (beta-lactamase superfamily II)